MKDALKALALTLACMTFLIVAGCAHEQQSEPTLPSVSGASNDVDVSPVSGRGLARVKDRVDVDPNLLQPCRPPTDLQHGDTMDDLMNYHQSDSLSYGECARRTDKLIDLLKKTYNLK